MEVTAGEGMETEENNREGTGLRGQGQQPAALRQKKTREGTGEGRARGQPGATQAPSVPVGPGENPRPGGAPLSPARPSPP